MRTKTLFLASAALAAGVATSVAQSNVYSVNIVGYVNQSLTANQLKLVANPLDDGTNKLSSALAALPNGSSVYVWNGSGYDNSLKSKGLWSPDLNVPPGVGFFVESPSDATNTYVGQTAVGPGGTATNSLTAGVITLTGSKLPYGGDLTSADLALGTSLDNGSQIFQWTGSGYQSSLKSKGLWSPNLTFQVGEGMFIQSANTANWTNSIPAQ